MLKYVKNLLFIYKVLKIRLLTPGVNNRNKINNKKAPRLWCFLLFNYSDSIDFIIFTGFDYAFVKHLACIN